LLGSEVSLFSGLLTTRSARCSLFSSVRPIIPLTTNCPVWLHVDSFRGTSVSRFSFGTPQQLHRSLPSAASASPSPVQRRETSLPLREPAANRFPYPHRGQVISLMPWCLVTDCPIAARKVSKSHGRGQQTTPREGSLTPLPSDAIRSYPSGNPAQHLTS